MQVLCVVQMFASCRCFCIKYVLCTRTSGHTHTHLLLVLEHILGQGIHLLSLNHREWVMSSILSQHVFWWVLSTWELPL